MEKLRILFQGDSITDAFRHRELDSYLGSGYPNFITGILGNEYPDKFEFINRGVSGNRVVDMYVRIRKDIIDLEPDYLSILIGINDVWHELECGDGIESEKFEKVYDLMLEEITKKLPNTKLILMEPFIVKGSATNSTDEVFRYFKIETNKRRGIIKKMSKKYNALFVPLQDIFDCLEKENKNIENYVRDGIHPTAAGSLLIANRWIDMFKKNIYKK